MATDERGTEHNVQSKGLGSNAPDKKKGSKFQPFKKFFGRRKKRETTPDREATKLKASSSFGNVCNGALSSDEETNNGLRSSNYSMGTRAFSHDSIFMPDGRAESEESIQAMSQDNLVGKVKTLQQQLAKNIKFGQPSQMTVSVKATGEASASLEADVLLNNPMETVMPSDVVLPENHHKSAVMPDSLSPARLGETSYEIDEKVTTVKVSSRPKKHHSPSGTIETVNLDAIPLATACLDNSAAKHKLSVRPKNQRVSKKHRLSKEVQSVIATEFGQEILESQGSEDKTSKDDGYHGQGKLIQHREVQEQKTEGRRKQDHWINLEAGKKEQMAEVRFKSHMEHKRLQEFEGSQGEQVGKKPKLQEEQLHQMEGRKDQGHQVKGQKEQENQGRNEERPEKLQAQIQEKSQELGERKQMNQEQAQHELEAQRQQEEEKLREMEMQWQQEKKKKQQELEAQWQLEEAKRQYELEVQRQQQEDQKRREMEAQRQQEEAKTQCELELQTQQEEAMRQHELEVQRQQQEEQKRQCELELQRQWEEEQKRQCELEVQRQQEEAKRQHDLELQRQEEEEQKRQRELELQRQREEEQKRQRELELQRQWEEEQRRQRELELQRQREEEQKRQRELELQRQEEEEQKRQRELELQRQREEKAKRQRELELQRQREEEQKRQRELELQRQREEEQKRQRELELQRQREEEQKRQRELELQRQEEEEQKRQRELELQRQREEKAKRQRELELQRQREEEQKRQCELELQRQREEEQKRQRELELQRQREEEQKRQRELELQRQEEEEQKRQCELELQRQWEEAKRQHELEVQRQQQEEWKQHEQEAQRQQEKKKRQCEQEEQRHEECEVQKQQKVKDQKEEKGHQETEENGNSIQQGWKDKKQEPEKQKVQEEKLSHQNLEKQEMKELKTGQTDESEKLSELNQQPLQEQKREIGQRQKERENSKNLDGRDKLQEKGIAMKLKQHEQQQQNLGAKQLSRNEQKQQKSARSVGSTEHRKLEPAEVGHLWAEKEVQQEEFIQRTEGLQLEGQKIIRLGEQRPLEKPEEEDKSHQSRMNINQHSEDEHLETVEKELPLKEEPRQQQRIQPGKELKEEGSLRINQRMNIEVEEQERVLGEELRWQEVDARQTMSRGFTFQVASGEKEIIFPKVNLSPVTPTKEAPLPSATKEFKDPKSSRGSNSLPTSLCVPHTAILVTGAQLCGTAVNLNQIKDTACKSLLGLTEEKKAMDVAQPESIQKLVDGRPNSTKVKHVQDSVDNQAILAEWASIRSKILKGAENDKLNEKDNGSLNRHSDDWTTKGRSNSHGNLRKTLSANAKFSITPAWQKFSESSKISIAAENKTAPEVENAAMQLSPLTLDANNEAVQTEAPVGTKNVGTSPGKIRGQQEVAGNTEGCKFAKDLPSFLVPSLPYSPNKETSPSETLSTMETQQNVGSKKLDRASPSGEENVSPFGVKLRRTNYSLRFHYDQQAEQKKKKRYSAGDSFDGLPTPLVTPDNEQDAKPLFLKDSKSLSQERKDARLNSGNATLTIISHNYTIVAPISSPTGHMSAPGQEKSVSKSPLPPKPALAPKPISQTPPPSPLSKPRRSHFTEPIGKRGSKVEPDTSWRKSEGKGSPHFCQATSESKNEEEESREKKSFFPSITMPWREKAEKKPEPLKKERPVLQSRHSIDGSKLMEKGETAQPLWITLALQKQKGFREQQATRDERRQAREAKQAEKLAKENASINNQADNKSNNMSRSNILHKSTAPEEEKKIEMATSRFERREQFKKSNTLPSSVTVEITDSVSSSPLAKEVTKRFSTPDANPVSTEPAWLALAKRKAKAWSDCPQIIK